MIGRVAQIMIDARHPRGETQRFFVKAARFGHQAVLHRNGAERVPKFGIVRNFINRAAQNLDRLFLATHIAQDAAQIVVAKVIVRTQLNKQAEEFFRRFVHLKALRHHAEIHIEFGVFGIELEGALIHFERLMQFAEPLKRERERVKCLRAMRVSAGHLHRKQRRRAEIADFVSVERLDELSAPCRR